MSNFEGYALSATRPSLSLVASNVSTTAEPAAEFRRQDLSTAEQLRLIKYSTDCVQYLGLCEKYRIELHRVVLIAQGIDAIRDQIIAFAYANLLVPLGLVETILAIDPNDSNCWFPVVQFHSQPIQLYSSEPTSEQVRLDRSNEGERKSLFW
jgi:hypothetical protein